MSRAALSRVRISWNAILVVAVFLGGSGAWPETDQPLEKTEVIESSLAGVAGQRQAFDKAIEKVTFEIIDEYIGEARRVKSTNAIRNRIIRNSGKYVLLIKSLGSKPKGEGVETTVHLKVSPVSLEALLAKEGLLYRSDGPPRVLPMVTFTDRVNSTTSSWWIESMGGDRSLLNEISQTLNRELKSELRSRGFYLIDPTAGPLRALVPVGFQRDNLGAEDLGFLARLLGAQVTIRGSVVVMPQAGLSDSFRVSLRLSANHVNNGRVIGEVTRVYVTETGSLKPTVMAKFNEVGGKVMVDFANQIHDVWQSGTFGANLLKVALKGALSPKEIDLFKLQVLAQLKDLKNIKERLFEVNKVTYEADTTVSAAQLAEKLKQVKVSGFSIKVEGVQADGIVLVAVGK